METIEKRKKKKEKKKKKADCQFRLNWIQRLQTVHLIEGLKTKKASRMVSWVFFFFI